MSINAIIDYGVSCVALALILLVAAYALKAVVMIIPGALLYVVAGVLFPTGWAIAITYLCLSLELTIGYINGKKLGKGKVNKLLIKSKHISALFEERKDNLPYLCFISRVLPFPVDLVSMFFGAVKMPFKGHLFISLLGKSPVVIPYVLAGTAITNPLTAKFLVPFGVSLFITVTVFALSILLQKTQKRRRLAVTAAASLSPTRLVRDSAYD